MIAAPVDDTASVAVDLLCTGPLELSLLAVVALVIDVLDLMAMNCPPVYQPPLASTERG